MQQLDVTRLQLHIHSQLVQSCQSVELGKGCQLSWCEAWHSLMALTQLVVVVSIKAAQVALCSRCRLVSCNGCLVACQVSLVLAELLADCIHHTYPVLAVTLGHVMQPYPCCVRYTE